MNNMISHPPHYIEGRKYEPKDVIRDWNLNFSLGNAVKYISRAGRKGSGKTIEDLEKAVFYINDEIEALRSQTPDAEWFAEYMLKNATSGSEVNDS